MSAIRVALFLVAVGAYGLTCVGLCVRATDHRHDAPAIETPRDVPQRKEAGELSPGPVRFEGELVDLRAGLRDHATRGGK